MTPTSPLVIGCWQSTQQTTFSSHHSQCYHRPTQVTSTAVQFWQSATP